MSYLFSKSIACAIRALRCGYVSIRLRNARILIQQNDNNVFYNVKMIKVCFFLFLSEKLYTKNNDKIYAKNQ